MLGMCLTSRLFRRRYSAKGAVVKKISWIKKGFFHLIRRHFLEFGLQERDPGREGNSNEIHYTEYIYYTHYTGYIN